MTCVVCSSNELHEVYKSDVGTSFTSLSTVVNFDTEVFACKACGHIQTACTVDVDEFYADDYDILVESDDEDILYQPALGEPVYRFGFQTDVLLSKLDLKDGARILDYGAAKGASLRNVLEKRPDLQTHLFDVSERYLPFWKRFLSEDRWSTFSTPDSWKESFDAITSFFVLEHIPDPLTTLKLVRELLAPGGEYFFLVPDMLNNIGDLVVVDHVNHFTESSIRQAAAITGFEVVDIDRSIYNQAIAVTLRRNETKQQIDARMLRGEAEQVVAEASKMGEYWAGISERIAAMEDNADGRPTAIYGAGFYGNFLFTRLAHPENVIAFVDRNKHLQGRMSFGVPIVAPEELDAAVTDVFVGLNPTIARGAIDTIDLWHKRPLQCQFL